MRLRDGRATVPPPSVLLVNHAFSIATAAAKVTTASCTPRMRSAETPTSRPMTVAASAAISGPNGNPMPSSAARCETRYADTPASASCMIDICPTKPVMMMIDRVSAAAIDGVDQGLSEVEREHDQRGDADTSANTPVGASRSGPRHDRQSLLHVLAALWQLVAAHEQRDHDRDQNQHLLDPWPSDSP